MTSFDRNVESIQDQVETALCNENSHVVLFYDSKWDEIYSHLIPFGGDIKESQEKLKTKTRTYLTTVDLSEEIDPQIKKAKSSLRKKSRQRL